MQWESTLRHAVQGVTLVKHPYSEGAELRGLMYAL